MNHLTKGQPSSVFRLITLTFLAGIIQLTNQCLESISIMDKATEIIMVIISFTDTSCEQEKSEKNYFILWYFYNYVQLFYNLYLHNPSCILWDLDPQLVASFKAAILILFSEAYSSRLE